MANKAAKRIRETDMGPGSRRVFSFRMFGDAGIDNAGDIGGWINVEAAQWKGFQLQPLDAADAIGGTTTVAIEGAYELEDESDPFSAVGNAHPIGSLDTSTRYVSVESPFRFVRARVTAFAGDVATVGMHALS
jgi:hypothetical protein